MKMIKETKTTVITQTFSVDDIYIQTLNKKNGKVTDHYKRMRDYAKNPYGYKHQLALMGYKESEVKENETN